MSRATNFQDLKENFQPPVKTAESFAKYRRELAQMRQKFEQNISNYKGDDPLDLWFEYVSWTEQNYPLRGKESPFDALLKKCISKFDKDLRYAQDRRLIRLLIKYIDTEKEPQKYYQNLHNYGIGTLVADLYIAWAYYYDIHDCFKKAEEVYQKGIDAGATPIDQLKLAHDRFRSSISDRMLGNDAFKQNFLSSLKQQRSEITSLQNLKTESLRVIRNVAAAGSGQAVRNIPKVSSSKDGNEFTNGIQLPLNFVRRNKVQTEMYVPPYVEESIEPNVVSAYDCLYLHPNNRQSFSIEELAAYKYFKKNNISNRFTEEQDKIWTVGPDTPVRLPPTFARRNQPQPEFFVETPIPMTERFMCKLHELYPDDSANELSFEELLKIKWLLSAQEDALMDETFCVKGIESFGVQYTRTAIVPGSGFWLACARPDEMMDETVCVGERQSFGIQCARRTIVPNPMPFINNTFFTLTQDDSTMEVDVENTVYGKLEPSAERGRNIDEQLQLANNESLDDSSFSHIKDDMELDEEISTVKRLHDSLEDTFDTAELMKSDHLRRAKWSVLNLEHQSGSHISPPIKEKRVDFLLPQSATAGKMKGFKEKRNLELVFNQGGDDYRKQSDELMNQCSLPEYLGAKKKNYQRNDLFKLPEPMGHKKIFDRGDDDSDHSFCDQHFNVNLKKEMASTPFGHRQQEAQFDATPISVQHPHQLSTILETTEKFAKTASQLSSLEDADLAKRHSNCWNQNKLVAHRDGSETDSSGSKSNIGNRGEAYKIDETPKNFDKISPAVPFKIYEDSGTANTSQSPSKPLRPNFATSNCNDHAPLAANQHLVDSSNICSAPKSPESTDSLVKFFVASPEK